MSILRSRSFARLGHVTAAAGRRLEARRQRRTAAIEADRLWPTVRAAAADARVELVAFSPGDVAGDDQAGHVRVRAADGRELVLRFAVGERAIAGLRSSDLALRAARAAGPPLVTVIPAALLAGTAGDVHWRLETLLPGVAASDVPLSPVDDRLLAELGRAVLLLRDGLGTRRALATDEIAPGLEADAAVVASLVGRRPNLAPIAAGIVDVPIPVGWIHGDLWAGNLLVEPGGLALSGIVDWDSARPAMPAFHDALHLLLTARRRAQHVSLGAAIRQAVETARWSAVERDLLVAVGVDAGAPDGSNGSLIRLRPAVAAYWLRQIAANLARRPALARDARWVRDNVADVGEWA
jgi:hypothetical protein